MAEELGKKLLDEVEEVTLNSFLRALHYQHHQYPENVLQFPLLDDIINPLLELSRHDRNPSIADLKTGRGLLPPIIELTGIGPSSGKTQLLYQCVANLLIPSKSSEARGSAVIWVDLGPSLDILRLRNVLNTTLSRSLGHQLAPAELASAVRNALTHLHVFRPSSPLSASLISTIRSLPSYILDTSLHASGSRVLSTIILPEMNVFLWTTDPDPSSSSSDTRETRMSPQDRFAALRIALRDVQRTLNCTVLNTAVAFSEEAARTGRHLPAAWGKGVDARLVVRRDSQNSGKGAKFIGEVRKCGPEASGKDPAFGNFEFWVGEEGLLLERAERSAEL